MSLFGEKIKEIISKKPRLAIFVDGPNVLRKDVNLSLKAIKEHMKEIGSLKISRVFLNQNAPDKLIEAAVNEGFEVVSTPSDIDVCMAVDATDVIHNPNIDVIVLVTRDTDFHFVLKKAKEHGKTTIVVAAKSNFSSALRNTADEVLVMEPDYYADKGSEVKGGDQNTENTEETKNKELKEKKVVKVVDEKNKDNKDKTEEKNKDKTEPKKRKISLIEELSKRIKDTTTKKAKKEKEENTPKISKK